MKRQMMFVLMMSIASAFSVRAQETVRSSIAASVEKSLPDSVKSGIGSLLITSRGTLFAAEGLGGYIWRSRDYGNSWEYLTSLPSLGGLSLIESSLGHIFLGNLNGIYRSTDEGESWGEALVGDSIAAALNFKKNRDGHLFVSTSSSQKPLFRSTDHGETWTPLAQGVFDSSITPGLCISQEGWVYLGTGGFMPMTPPRERGKGVFRSKDNGETWEAINSGLPIVEGYIPIWPVATAPNGNVYAGVLTSGMYRSTDYGDTWQESNGNLTERYPTALYSHEGAYLFAGFESRFPNKGGVYLSLDRGNFWEYLGLEKKGIIGSFAFAPDSSYLFVGTQQDGVWRIKLNLITKVEEVDNIPSSFTLHQNYPNPFNPSTSIEFTLLERSAVRLTVYNALSQEVATLVNEEVPAGTHKTSWDASGLPSGIYFARFEVHSDRNVGAQNFVATKKMEIGRAHV